MEDSASEQPVPAFKDRSGSLVVGGVVEIILGVLSALLVPMMILGLLFSAANVEQAAGPHPATQIPGILFYVFAAVFFVWMGIGSIRARRWARAIMLVVSWLWLVGGVAGLLSWLVYRSSFTDAMLTASGDMPAAAAQVIQFVITTVLAIFYVVLPGLFLLLYHGNNVKTTCEFKDPETRWTDKVPLPVLAVCLCLGYAAVTSLLSLFYNVLPFFGQLVSGRSAAAMAVVLAVILAVLTVWTYKLRPAGWWGSMLLLVLGTASAVMTFEKVDMLDLYERMGFREPQLEMMENFWSGIRVTWWVAAFAIASAGYLVFVKRYFTAQVPSAESPTPSP